MTQNLPHQVQSPRPEEPKGRNDITKAVLTFLLVTLLTLLLPFLGGCGVSAERSNTNDGAGESSEEPAVTSTVPVAVRVETPEYRTLEQSISYVGTVATGTEVTLIARVQGTLADIQVGTGAEFAAGNLLALLDAPEIDAKRARLQADADYWCRRNESDERLVEQGALPAEQAASSRRACESARAGLAEVEAQLEKMRIVAPFSGELLDWLAEQGQPLMPGQPVAVIGDSNRVLQVEVIEEDLDRGIAPGTVVTLRGSDGALLESSVTEVAAVASGPGRTFTVTVPLPALPGSPPRKGASLPVSFVLAREEMTLAVPQRAIARSAEGEHIFLVNRETVRRQPVVSGIRQDGWTSVSFPWDGEERVAVTNLNSLTDGVRVFPVKRKESPQ